MTPRARTPKKRETENALSLCGVCECLRETGHTHTRHKTKTDTQIKTPKHTHDTHTQQRGTSRCVRTETRVTQRARTPEAKHQETRMVDPIS